MAIIFENIRFKNFLSFGNTWTEVDLLKAKKTLIQGKNGSGKSSIIDALTFGLFNRPFRKINKSSLANSINQKDAMVEITFRIKDSHYKIVRGMYPSVFEIYVNGVLRPQDASNRDYQSYLEKDVLKLNYRTFTQIVILGSGNYVQFMKLGSAAKREIIEDILDISVFSRMNDILKPMIKDSDTQLRILEAEKEMVKSQYKFMFDKSLQNKDTKEKRKKSRKEAILELEVEKFAKESAKEEILGKQVKVPSDKAEKSKKSKLAEYSFGIKKNLQQVDEEISFYDANDTCQKCKQTIDGEFKKERVSFLQTKKEEFYQALQKINASIKEVTDRMKEITDLANTNSQVKSEIAGLESAISSIEYRISSLNQDLEDIDKEDDSIISIEELDVLKNKVKMADTALQAKNHEIHIMKIGLSLLKDSGAKTSIIKFYLPLINKTINEFLEKFDFNVLFMFDENFDETMKARHIDSFSYGNFSEGERNRIDLSLVFAWREIAKKKNSASTNLLFFDEVLDSGMDAAGLESFMQVIDAYDPNANLFVISHREGVEAGFDASIVAKKENNFSSYHFS